MIGGVLFFDLRIYDGFCLEFSQQNSPRIIGLFSALIFSILMKSVPKVHALPLSPYW